MSRGFTYNPFKVAKIKTDRTEERVQHSLLFLNNSEELPTLVTRTVRSSFLNSLLPKTIGVRTKVFPKKGRLPISATTDPGSFMPVSECGYLNMV